MIYMCMLYNGENYLLVYTVYILIYVWHHRVQRGLILALACFSSRIRTYTSGPARPPKTSLLLDHFGAVFT